MLTCVCSAIDRPFVTAFNWRPVLFNNTKHTRKFSLPFDVAEFSGYTPVAHTESEIRPHSLGCPILYYMPKFPKGFGRRKSSGSAFEDVQAPPPVPEHTFKVFERPEGASKSFDGGVKLAKATNGQTTSHLASRPKTSYREENMFENILHGNRSVPFTSCKAMEY